jgi:arylsulfatase A-like enzyme
MASENTRRWTIIGRVGLLGASIGIALGLFEAACLRLTSWPLSCGKPHVSFSFWFFDPAFIAVIFGLLGLAIGVVARLVKHWYLRISVVAGFVGLAGTYAARVLQYSQSVTGWYIVVRGFLGPGVVFAAVFAWTLLALWATRKPDNPLGFVSGVPTRSWSYVVVTSMTVLLIALGLSYIPDHFAGATVHATNRQKQPNIVLIVWDTTRADHLSAYGYSRKTTPRADQLAGGGVLFENAISPSSWTLPADASIFTGLLPHQHGASSDLALPNGPRTLAEILQAAGWETAGFNANSYYGTSVFGLNRGFETYVDSTTSLGYSVDATRVGSDFIEPLTEQWFHFHRFNQFTATGLNEKIYNWFDHRNSDRPYFLFINYNDAHEPYEAPAAYAHRFGDASEEARRLLAAAKFGRFYLPDPDRAGAIAEYDGCLNYIDSEMGNLLDFLARSPDWSNTYVILTSDHGESFGDHGVYKHAWNLYREALHVPLVISGPGIPPGVRVHDIAGTRRLFSTILEMAGMNNGVLQRNSLARLWEPGPRPTASARIISEVMDPVPLPAPQGLISVITPEWHLIYRHSDERSELYHWPTDPLEEQNVIDAPVNAALSRHLEASLLAMIKGSYRPWREPRYLFAFSPPGSPLDLRILDSAWPAPEAGASFPRAGAAQALFTPNREVTLSDNEKSNKELLESLPYDAR